MFGDLSDPATGIPEGHESHSFHPAYGHCLNCGCSAFNRGVATRECVPKIADAPVTVPTRGAREVDWFDLNRSCSA